jgi:hypothetical protein
MSGRGFLAVVVTAAVTAFALVAAVTLTAMLGGPWELVAICCVLGLAVCGLAFWGLVSIGRSDDVAEGSYDRDRWQS